MREFVQTTNMVLDSIELAETFLRLEEEGDPGVAVMIRRAGPENWGAYAAANRKIIETAKTSPPVRGQPIPEDLRDALRVAKSALAHTGCFMMMVNHPVIRRMIDREESIFRP